MADNQAITRLGVKYLALEAGRELSSIKEAVGLQELSMMLSSYPDSVVIIDYTLFDCTADQLWILKERFSQSVFVLFSDALSGGWSWEAFSLVYCLKIQMCTRLLLAWMRLSKGGSIFV